jgi:prephenate dehydrogenase
MVDQLLSALGDRLQLRDAHYGVVVVGGSALLALGLVDRPTHDIDLVALRADDALITAVPLPAVSSMRATAWHATSSFPRTG